MAISPPLTAAKAVLVCSRSTDLQAIKVCGRRRRPPETAEKDETPLGSRSVKIKFLSMTWAEVPELDHDHDDPSLTELAKLAPLMAPLLPP